MLISFLTDLFIPFGAILDYFIYFLVTYIFVFIISVLAISLSGNIMGFIIIILLLLLLYPSLTFIEYKTRSDYLDTYYLCESEECMPTIEYCGDDNNCLKEIESGKYHYRVIQKYNSTLTTTINYFNEGFNTKSIINYIKGKTKVYEEKLNKLMLMKDEVMLNLRMTKGINKND